jgi:hypothetical protein
MFWAREQEEKSQVCYVPHHRSCDRDLSVRLSVISDLRACCGLPNCVPRAFHLPQWPMSQNARTVKPAYNEIQRRQNILRLKNVFLDEIIALGSLLRVRVHWNLSLNATQRKNIYSFWEVTINKHLYGNNDSWPQKYCCQQIHLLELGAMCNRRSRSVMLLQPVNLKKKLLYVLNV